MNRRRLSGVSTIGLSANLHIRPQRRGCAQEPCPCRARCSGLSLYRTLRRNRYAGGPRREEPIKPPVRGIATSSKSISRWVTFQSLTRLQSNGHSMSNHLSNCPGHALSNTCANRSARVLARRRRKMPLLPAHVCARPLPALEVFSLNGIVNRMERSEAFWYTFNIGSVTMPVRSMGRVAPTEATRFCHAGEPSEPTAGRLVLSSNECGSGQYVCSWSLLGWIRVDTPDVGTVG